MKKIIAIIFILSLTLSLAGCNLFFIPSENSESTNTVDNNPPQEAEEETASEQYKSLICRSANDYIEARFSFYGSESFITLLLPDNWIIKEADSSYEIYYGANKIGKVSAESDFVDDNWNIIESKEGGNAPLLAKSYIEYNYDDSNTPIFRHRFVYSFDDSNAERKISIYVNYKEADSLTVFKMRESARLDNTSCYTRYNDLKDLRDSKILMLGNSFIASSMIGDILNEMFLVNGKSASVNAVSKSYATISKYIEDEEITRDISNSEYDVIFICGLYSEADLYNLKNLITICQMSDTKLVFFPAHNEKDFLVNEVLLRYPEIYLLNWKYELEMIIDAGVRKIDLCYDDGYSHSNSIAGFVGANMIYRAIYGESPNFDNMSSINQADVNRILNEYLSSGYIVEKIYYFK